MKKLLILLLLSALLVPCAVAEIDLSGMSYDELVELKDQINLAMWQCDDWQEVRVPQGVWLVGEDIPAGHWTMEPMDGVRASIYICTELDETGHDPAIGGLLDYNYVKSPQKSNYVDGEDLPVWDCDLTDGLYVIIKDGDVIFTPYQGKPSLSFK